jgi:hypothetical protein
VTAANSMTGTSDSSEREATGSTEAIAVTVAW